MVVISTTKLYERGISILVDINIQVFRYKAKYLHQIFAQILKKNILLFVESLHICQCSFFRLIFKAFMDAVFLVFLKISLSIIRFTVSGPLLVIKGKSPAIVFKGMYKYRM